MRNLALPLPSLVVALPACLCLLAGCGTNGSETASASFSVELSEEAEAEMASMGLETPVTGRAYLIFTRNQEREPRQQTGLSGAPFWGWEVRDLAGGGRVVLEVDRGEAIGYPLKSFRELPAGQYTAQAFLNVFTTFNRSDGPALEMHLNSGAGQSPWRAPGNAFSSPQEVQIKGRGKESFHFTIDQVIPSREPVPEGGTLQQGNPTDQGDFVRFVKIRSEVLSAFWGRDMYVGANVLLPSDYWTDTNRRYPVLYLTGHFPGGRTPFGYADAEESSRGRSAGFSEFWRSPDSPKMILVSVRDANPFYDTGHSVNSANVGPYGDAFVEELIPYLEAEFRMIPESWARVLAGGSTGGWEALAIQVFNPDEFGGTWGWCPDPVDFHYYQI
ncbi:MAG: alpha/beta hydrolase-fold protein, partial [Gemmatimonadota bacterium]